MNLLFELYALSYPINQAGDSRDVFRNVDLETRMVLMAVITTLCTAGVAFYVRVIVALCKEYKKRWIAYLVRIEPEEEEDYTVVEQRELDEAFRRAA